MRVSNIDNCEIEIICLVTVSDHPPAICLGSTHINYVTFCFGVKPSTLHLDAAIACREDQLLNHTLADLRQDVTP
jgi:hypothetical protein